MKFALLLRPMRVVCALACLAMMWALACNGDDEPDPNNGGGGSTTTGTGGAAGGATGGSTSGTAGGATGGAAGGVTGGGGATAAGGAGGAGGSADPLAGEYNHECLPSSPECLGGWVCKVEVCDYCIADDECANDDCNTSNTFRCAAQGLCTVPGDCPSNSVCDSGACVYDHPSQGTCGVDALYYAHDQTPFTPTYSARLSGAISCIVSTVNGGTTLTLDVFADNIGSHDYNLSLTQSRGNALRGYLVSQGASSGGITVVAHGAQQSTGIYEADRAADRRVEFNWN